MAQKLDYKQMAADIVGLVGGPENVNSLSHCMTRLRFILKDEGKADAEAIKKIKGVLGVVSAGGQFMVILGQNLLPVYDAALKDFHLSAGANTDENLDEKEKEPLTVKSALLLALAANYLEKFFNKIIPGIFKSLLVGLCTVTCTGILQDKRINFLTFKPNNCRFQIVLQFLNLN